MLAHCNASRMTRVRAIVSPLYSRLPITAAIPHSIIRYGPRLDYNFAKPLRLAPLFISHCNDATITRRLPLSIDAA